MAEHVEKYVAVFYKDSMKEATAVLDKLRKEDLKLPNWRVTKSYIGTLKNGKYRVVRKYDYVR